MGLTRRILIAGGGVVVLGTAAAAAGSLVFCARESRLAGLPLERLDVALADIAAPDRLARALRAAERPEAIEAAFLGRGDLLETLRVDCPESRRAAIRSAFREDFRRGDVVVADRWIVARAEGLIAALRWAGGTA